MTADARAASLEERIDAAWKTCDREHPDATVEFFGRLHAEQPDDAVRIFELASAYDWVAREADAIPLYEAAIDVGLEGDRDRQARIQLGSSLRNVGRAEEAVAVLDDALRLYPGSAAVRCFLALALADAGEARRAAAVALDAALNAGDGDLDEYRRPLERYAADLA